jgi:tRNA dimethylallyltransferase
MTLDDSKQSTSNVTPPLIIVIAGPTASGKSDVAAKICAYRRGMIISADSVQAYRGVQVGANKPTQEELDETPHVLIDVADHKEQYNAAEWREDAIFCIQTLLQQNRVNDKEKEGTTFTEPRSLKRRQDILKYIDQSCHDKGYNNGSLTENSEIIADSNPPILPVICGGTMMYLQWLVHGRPDAFQPTPKAVKESFEIIEKYQSNISQDSTKNYQEAVMFVSSFGEIFADRTKQFCGEDWYRLRRTLEIALTVEEQSNGNEGNVSDAESKQVQKNKLVENLYSGERQGGLGSFGYDVRCFFLCPDDRMGHTRVIDERCEQMIMKGLISETTNLKLSGCFPDMAERAIGYRQTLDYLHKELGPDETDKDLFEQYLDDFTTATRRYAKKQMAWFRKDKDFVFVTVPLQMTKQERVDVVAKQIEKYISLSRLVFESMLVDRASMSLQCKHENELQGKAMKFYQPQRHILKDGSEPYKEAFTEAIQCRERIQEYKSRSRKRSLEGVVEAEA